jgi:hypothetical protein
MLMAVFQKIISIIESGVVKVIYFYRTSLNRSLLYMKRMKFATSALLHIKCYGAILLLLFSASCKKSTMKIGIMPAATQHGSNTMGAYINNVLWVPALSFYDTGIDADYALPNFSIDGLVENPDGSSKTAIYITIRNFNGVGTYTLNANPYGTTGNTADCSRFVDSNYITDSLHLGSVIITHFDDRKHIVSGTFQIKLINDHNPADSIYVSSGRFDVTCPLTFPRG